MVIIDKLAPYGTWLVLIGAVIAAVGAFLQSQNNRALNADLRTKSAELLELQNGLVAYTKGIGSYFYLQVVPTPGTNFALLIVKREGKNPVYEAEMNIVDSQARRQPQRIELGTLGSDAVTGARQLSMDFGDFRHLTIYLTSRNAQHRQDIRLRRVNGQPVAATRVVETFNDAKVIYEKVDDAFPRDEKGRVDWSD